VFVFFDAFGSHDFWISPMYPVAETYIEKIKEIFFFTQLLVR